MKLRPIWFQAWGFSSVTVGATKLPEALPRLSGSGSPPQQAASSETSRAGVEMDQGGGEIVFVLQPPQGPLQWSGSLYGCRDKVKATNVEPRMQTEHLLRMQDALTSICSVLETECDSTYLYYIGSTCQVQTGGLGI